MRGRGKALLLVLLAAAIAAGGWLVAGGGVLRRGGDEVAVDDAAPSDAQGADASEGAHGATREEPKGASLLGRRLERGSDPEEPAAVSGLVVDEERKPVAGATVSLRVPDLPEATTVAGADGRFRLQVTFPEGKPVAFAGGLHANDGRGRAGVEIVRFVRAAAAAGADGPTVEIRPTGTLRVSVRRGGEPVAGARVLAWSAPEAGLPETGVRVADSVAGGDGVARLDGVPTGPIALVAVATDGTRSRSVETTVAAKEAEVAVPMDADVVRVLVVNDGEASRATPVPSALVEAFRSGGPHEMPIAFAPPIAPMRTDASGYALSGVPRGEPVAFRVTPSDAEPVWFDSATYDEEAVLRVVGARTMRWDVVAGGDAPANGTPVAVRLGPAAPPRGDPTERRAFVRGGRVVLEDAPHDAWYAFGWLPDGRVATLSFVLDDEGSRPVATFHAPRRLEVRVVDDDGAAVAGVPIRLEREGVRASDEAVTDAEGRAAIGTPFAADDAGVEVGMVVGGVDFVSLGTVGAAAMLDLVIPSVREVSLHVRVDGEKRLPQGLRADWVGALETHVEEDAGSATLRVAYRPAPEAGETNELRLSAPGVATEKVRLAGRGEPLEKDVDVRLARTMALVLRVVAPEGYRATPTLERLDPPGPVYRPGPIVEGGTVRWDPLPVGDYEVRDAASGISSGPIEVRGAPGAVEAVLDLSDLIRVRGRIDARDRDLVRLGVLVAYADPRRPDSIAQERGIDDQGRFDLWLPRRRGVALQPVARLRTDGSRVVGPAHTLHTSTDDLLLLFE